jgi:hypothetical protein
MDSRVQGREGPATYVYRRELGASELLPAVGAAIVTGLAAFYVARLLLQRTPLEREDEMLVVSETGHRGRHPAADSRGPRARSASRV